jgi:branched-chain amino acid aminotransferase
VTGRIFRLDRHIMRLERSAELIGLQLPWPAKRVPDLLADLLGANRLRDARIRLTVTRGRGRPGDFVEATGPPTVVATAAPFAGPDPALYETGVSMTISKRSAVPAAALDPAIKSISRLASVLARRDAQVDGAHEAVLLDARGHLTEGTASNLFVVENGRLATPRIPEGGLPGITRQTVLELARRAGIESGEETLPAARLPRVDEVFLTNTSWELLPVTRIDAQAVGTGRPGPVTRDLHARYRALIRLECTDA